MKDNETFGVDAERGPNMHTYLGRPFFPLDPRPEEVDIQTIAHAAGNLCRWGGHVVTFFSVAQHSVLVSRLVNKKLAMCALMHDASEAFCQDVIRPIKHALGKTYEDIEAEIYSAIAERYGLPACVPPEVELADRIVAYVEKEELLHHCGLVEWGRLDEVAPLADGLTIERCWGPEEAKDRFLARFAELS